MSSRENIKLVNGVKILAIIDGVCGWFIDVLLLLDLVTKVAIMVSLMDFLFERGYYDTFSIIRLVFVFSCCLFLVLLAVILFRGAKNNDRRNFQIWFCVTVALVVLHMIGLFLSLIDERFDVFMTGLYMAQIGYKTYEMKLVNRFMEVLANKGEITSPTVLNSKILFLSEINT